MSVIIPDKVMHDAHMSETEFIQEIAIMLFQKERLTLAQASRLAKMNQFQFQHLLASRQISIHYDVLDFEKDIATLKKLNRI